MIGLYKPEKEMKLIVRNMKGILKNFNDVKVGGKAMVVTTLGNADNNT